MKGAHREGKDSASCGHRSAGGCPTVFINGFPAMRAYGDSDRAGGQLLGPGAKNVFVGNARLSLEGDSVLPHGRGEHASATIATGSPDVLAAPNPAIDSWKVDDFASAGAGQAIIRAANDFWTIAKGAFSVLPDLLKLLQEKPAQAAALFLLCALCPEFGAVVAIASALGNGHELGASWLAVIEAGDGPGRDAALRRFGKALGGAGMTLGPHLMKALKDINPALVAKAVTILQRIARVGTGGKWDELLIGMEYLWNNDVLRAIRAMVPKDGIKIRPPVPLPEIPERLRRLGVRQPSLPEGKTPLKAVEKTKTR